MEVNIRIQDKYPYEEYHKIVDGILYKKCAYHNESFPNEDEWFPCTEEYFYKNKKNSSDGLYPECKKCSIKRSRNNAVQNQQRTQEMQNKYYMDNREKRLQEFREWYITNKDERRIYYSEYLKNNPDKIREYSAFRRMHKTHNINKQEWQQCKNYFNNECAYCGLPLSEHYYTRNGITKNGDFHKEHVDHEGVNNLSNCIPSCQSCNSVKNRKTLDEFYNENNPNYTIERYNKILQWLNEDHKQYIQPPKLKGKYTKKKKESEK